MGILHNYKLCLSLTKPNYTFSSNSTKVPLVKTVLLRSTSFYSSDSGRNSPESDGEPVNRVNSSLDVDNFLVDAEISGVGSPFSAMCWHKGPYSNYFAYTSESSQDVLGEAFNGKFNSRENTDEKELCPQVDSVTEMENLLSVERREKDRVRLLLERYKPLKIDEHIKNKELSSKISTLKLLSLSSRIANRPPSSSKPQVDVSKYLREKRYQKLISKDTYDSGKADSYRRYTSKNESTVETVRILDIDRIPLPILHHILCYTLVKNVPAENVLRVISNIASLRDKDKHVCYQNLFRLAIDNCGPLCSPEVVAVLTRSYQSISIPFMVDYVRRYGTFSRKFLSNLIDRHSHPMPLDFFRYESHSRTLPMILTRPWSLMSFVNLLKNSSAKRYMYLNLLNYGYVPNLTKFDKIHAYGTMDYDLSGQILSFEKMLEDITPISGNKEDPNRPKIYDKILDIQYSGDCNLDDMELGPDNQELKGGSKILKEKGQDMEEESQDPTQTTIQFVKVLRQEGLNDNSNHFTHNREFGNFKDAHPYRDGYKDLDEKLQEDGSHISWSLPWGLRKDSFHYRGRSYKMDSEKGWIRVKSGVKINYLKNVKMNKRKRERKVLRLRASKEAKLRVLSTM